MFAWVEYVARMRILEMRDKNVSQKFWNLCVCGTVFLKIYLKTRFWIYLFGWIVMAFGPDECICAVDGESLVP